MLNESKLDSNIYAYGSEEWSHDVKLAIETATKLAMSVSLTSGTNWSTANIAGLDPNSEAAEQEVGYSMETLAAGASKSGALKATAVRRGVDASTVKRDVYKRQPYICLQRKKRMISATALSYRLSLIHI